jgi:acetyl-CoA carboxylase carboxyl transferase subunit alpha
VGEGTPILVLGHQKGRSTKERMERNFGMARPEGYRKAMRLIRLAERSRMPILTLIDTPGAYPGLEAEERGQAQAIAESIQLLFEVTVPVCAVVIGEGGSGGALAIGVADKVLAHEYSTYSVISPESCASILWSDSSLAERAADKLKMNPPDLMRMGVIDGVIPEPKGGNHRDWAECFSMTRQALLEQFGPLIDAQRAQGQGHATSAAKSENGARSARKGAKAATPAAAQDAETPGPQSAVAQAARMARIEKFRRIGNFALAHAPASPEEQA